MRSPQAPATWTIVVLSYAFSLLIFGGAVAVYSFTTFDTRLSCERSTDICRVTHLKPFWTDEIERFPLSGVRSAAYTQKGGNATTGGKVTSVRNCAVLTLTSPARAIDICRGAGPELVAGINAFLARPDVPGFASTLETNVFDYALPMFMLLFSLPPFLGGTYTLVRKLRS